MKNVLRATVFAFVLGLAGCVTQLAPQYDQAIADGLTSTNLQIQTLFVQIGSSCTKATYPSRVELYNKIVAELNALEIQARARPAPPQDVLKKVDDALEKNGSPGMTVDPKFSSYPSARSIHDASDTMQHMSAEDGKAGLRGAELKAFENQVTVYMTQAITYEAFLKR